MSLRVKNTQLPELIYKGWNCGFVRVIHNKMYLDEILEVEIETLCGRMFKTVAGSKDFCLRYEDGTKEVI